MANEFAIFQKDLGLGIFSYPIYEFNERYEKLKATNPQLNEQERAAVAYFGMIAQQPKPTRTDNVGELGYFDLYPLDNWLDIERQIQKDPGGLGLSKLQSLGRPRLTTDAQQAYLNHIFRLQAWINFNGLWDGIQKTLNEESRKRQKDLANAQASQQAAAYALAMSRITDDMSEQARIDAAKKTADAQFRLEQASAAEEKIKAEISNLEKGLPADFGQNKTGWILAAVLGGVALLLLARGRK